MPTHRTRFFLLLLTGVLSTPFSQAATRVTPGEKLVAAITSRIEARDCAGAVTELKAGLKLAYPEVVLLAGTMYDHGVCVQRDWNRAVQFYSQANQAGLKEAADRLAAGFAAPENGSDVAAALWWASRGRTTGGPGGQALAPCTVSAAAADDVDRFAAELQTWPKERLAMCNYAAGVMSTLAGEIKYPDLARAHGVGGDVTLRFLPAKMRIELQRGDSREYQLVGVFKGEVVRDRDTEQVQGGFEKAIAVVANRALRRYPKPAGIPDDTAFMVRYVFTLD